MKLISYNLNIGTAHYNALSKCQRDGDAIAQKFGYKIYYRNKKVGNRLHQILLNTLDFSIFLANASAMIFFLNYPFYVFQKSLAITKFFMRFPSNILVVDINSFRFPKKISKTERLIKRVSDLILPSIQNVGFLKDHGLSDNKYEIIIHNLQITLQIQQILNIH